MRRELKRGNIKYGHLKDQQKTGHFIWLEEAVSKM
jgi:hypothetical protein